MLTTALAYKLVCVGASAIAARLLWLQEPVPKIKNQLHKAFKAADVYIVQEKYMFNGEKVNKRLYPKIRSAKQHEDRLEVDIQIPLGMDPKELNNRVWLLKQTFGPNVELDKNDDDMNFKVIIYNEGIEQFNYTSDLAKQAIKGMELGILCGMTREGMFAYDMTKHPHLLIAGETGSGKSTQLHSILMTLILFFYDKLELHLFDMKLSEFNIYEGIAHSFEYEENGVLRQLVRISKEMNKRMKLLKEHKKPSIMKLPEAVRPKYIVVAIDEVSELKGHKDIMPILERISAIGRALGVFIILSMQRPDRDILDGKLKNNLTVRMAFRHADEINSRITLGSGEGATIQQSEAGKFYLSLDGLKVLQAPYLDVEVAAKSLEQLQKEERFIPAVEVEEITEDDIEELEWFDNEFEG